VAKGVERFVRIHGDPEALAVIDDRDHDAVRPGSQRSVTSMPSAFL
jgi:hypothetical protein